MTKERTCVECDDFNPCRWFRASLVALAGGLLAPVIELSSLSGSEGIVINGVNPAVSSGTYVFSAGLAHGDRCGDPESEVTGYLNQKWRSEPCE